METSLKVDGAVLELNTIGTISVTKAVLPHMIDQGEGCIVFTSSIAGKLGELEDHPHIDMEERVRRMVVAYHVWACLESRLHHYTQLNLGLQCKKCLVCGDIGYKVSTQYFL